MCGGSEHRGGGMDEKKKNEGASQAGDEGAELTLVCSIARRRAAWPGFGSTAPTARPSGCKHVAIGGGRSSVSEGKDGELRTRTKELTLQRSWASPSAAIAPTQRPPYSNM